MTGFSFLLVFVGCFGVYWTRKRAFNRRNIAGVEEFKNYGTSLLTRVLERVISFSSWLLIAGGLVKIFMSLF